MCAGDKTEKPEPEYGEMKIAVTRIADDRV